ncbi:zf-HC2 domain-containing protein [bacterium]|nr:zf-HC2 domain-containing protein [bacterium]
MTVESNCEKIQELLLDYDEGFLEGESRQEVASHLETCQNCANYYRELKDSWQNLAKIKLPEIDPVPDYKERFWRKTEEEGARVTSKKHNLFPLFLALAASLACVFGLAVMYIFANPDMPSGSSAGVALEDKVVPVNEISEDAGDYYQGDFVYAEYTEPMDDDLLSQDLLDSAMREIYF